MAKTVLVDRGGIARIIPESKVEEFKAQGYKVINTGSKAKPTPKTEEK